MISISALDKFGLSSLLGNEKFSLFHESKLVSFDFLSAYDYLYLIDLIALFNESLKSRTNSAKESKVLDMTLVMSTMADMTVQMNNIQDRLLRTKQEA